jgi:hypothetical protein
VSHAALRTTRSSRGRLRITQRNVLGEGALRRLITAESRRRLERGPDGSSPSHGKTEAANSSAV